MEGNKGEAKERIGEEKIKRESKGRRFNERKIRRESFARKDR